MKQPAPQIELFTTTDGYAHAARVWRVPQPTARVLCLHGIISHGGWYLTSCRHLAGAGFEVHFLDRGGSGLNLPRRGDVDAWETWLGDVVRYLRQLGNDRPRILLGISWGGKLATAVARRHPDLLDGLGLLCPGLFARRGANPWQRMALRVANRLGIHKRRVTIPLQEPELFTAEPAWQHYIARDPLTLRKITLRFAAADLRLSRYATEAPDEIRVKTLLTLAGRDRIIDNSRVRSFVEQFAQPAEIVEYPEASHTLEFEADPTQFFNDLSVWMANCVKSPAAT